MPRQTAALLVTFSLLTGCGGDSGPTDRPATMHATTVQDAGTADLTTAADGAQAVARLAATGLPVYCGAGTGDAVALTFDDGPGPYTHYVLKRLRRNRQRATFFLTSRNLPRFGSLVAQELQHGMVGDHTVTHAFLPGLSEEQMHHEIDQAQTDIGAAAGTTVTLFRPPYEGHNAAIDAHVKDRAMLQILWNVDSEDSLGADYARIRDHVIASLRPGAIVLMHDNRGQTVRALPTILHALAKRHLRAVTVEELMAIDPPSDAQLKAGPKGCRGTR